MGVKPRKLSDFKTIEHFKEWLKHQSDDPSRRRRTPKVSKGGTTGGSPRRRTHDAR